MDTRTWNILKHVSLGFHPNDRQDLVQEAAIRVWQEGHTSPRLIYKAARYAMIDALRRMYGRPRGSQGYEEWKYKGNKATVESVEAIQEEGIYQSFMVDATENTSELVLDHIERGVVEEELGRAIGLLGDSQRGCFLAQLHGETTEVTAERLGITRSGVWANRSLATKKIAEFLRPHLRVSD